jgi:hypothetical protein
MFKFGGYRAAVESAASLCGRTALILPIRLEDAGRLFLAVLMLLSGT